MLTEYTNLDCYAEARLKAEITLAQRRITRLQQEIANKESESQQFVSPYFLEHFDDEIRHRLVQVAKLQGKVGAAQHELACIADKARIDAANVFQPPMSAKHVASKDVGNLHSFSWKGTDPGVSDRAANDSAQIAARMNKLLF